MLRRCARTALLTAALALAALVGAVPAAAEEVDLALVIAVDISYSMDPDEQDLQRAGFVEAFRSPLVHQAIRNGALGRIAVTYGEWAANWEQKVIVPWTVIEDPESAMAFAGRLAAQPTRRGPRTSVSGAIDFGVRLHSESGLTPTRRVIDISGDGANNQGRSVTAARDDAVAQGVTINGLPIMLKRPSSYWDVVDLDVYYRECVIGGAGAFIVPVRTRDEFVNAIKTKIIREVADYAPEPLIRRVQVFEGGGSCMAGEIQRERWGN
ncbi:MAG TPA: DUF1194 domain-containing protein [Beijerinckiaceae bacterium]|nr:DUF1194 domain-containing protein [Beijerinckiaceae bacterium]